MQSVFKLIDKTRFEVFCFMSEAHDNSQVCVCKSYNVESLLFCIMNEDYSCELERQRYQRVHSFEVFYFMSEAHDESQVSLRV